MAIAYMFTTLRAGETYTVVGVKDNSSNTAILIDGVVNLNLDGPNIFGTNDNLGV